MTRQHPLGCSLVPGLCQLGGELQAVPLRPVQRKAQAVCVLGRRLRQGRQGGRNSFRHCLCAARCQHRVCTWNAVQLRASNRQLEQGPRQALPATAKALASNTASSAAPPARGEAISAATQPGLRGRCGEPQTTAATTAAPSWLPGRCACPARCGEAACAARWGCPAGALAAGGALPLPLPAPVVLLGDAAAPSSWRCRRRQWAYSVSSWECISAFASLSDSTSAWLPCCWAAGARAPAAPALSRAL